MNTNKNLPVVVDLDGTLIFTDILYESLIKCLKTKFWVVLMLPFWLLKGKAYLKAKIANYVKIDVETLPYNRPLITWLKKEKKGGRKIFLSTASDRSVALKISSHLNLFTDVFASDGVKNLTGKTKATFLCEHFGEKKFVYAGNENPDLYVWAKSYSGIVVSKSKRLIDKAKSLTKIDLIAPPQVTLKSWVKLLRVHQWVKNLLLFAPMLAAHQINQIGNWQTLILAFFSFCLCASCIYIINDLFDLESDRLNSYKANRAFASGQISVIKGLMIAPILLLFSLLLGKYINDYFFTWIIIYFVAALSYSLILKKLVIIDCLTLAILYTLRLLAGGAAIDVKLSTWLLTFSIFLFLSLAFIKRYTELKELSSINNKKAHGRGYLTSDTKLIKQTGLILGYISVLVLALYLNSETAIKLYKNPEFIWGAIPALLIWINWMWLQSHRGNMHQDPILFAIKDKFSITAGMIFTLSFILAQFF